MTPKSTSAAESMLARTGRRIAVSESLICESFPGKVNRPDSPERNGRLRVQVPRSPWKYVERESGESTSMGPVFVRTRAPERIPKPEGAQDKLLGAGTGR